MIGSGGDHLRVAICGGNGCGGADFVVFSAFDCCEGLILTFLLHPWDFLCKETKWSAQIRFFLVL